MIWWFSHIFGNTHKGKSTNFRPLFSWGAIDLEIRPPVVIVVVGQRGTPDPNGVFVGL